jgi:hypothetical protein
MEMAKILNSRNRGNILITREYCFHCSRGFFGLEMIGVNFEGFLPLSL